MSLRTSGDAAESLRASSPGIVDEVIEISSDDSDVEIIDKEVAPGESSIWGDEIEPCLASADDWAYVFEVAVEVETARYDAEVAGYHAQYAEGKRKVEEHLEKQVRMIERCRRLLSPTEIAEQLNAVEEERLNCEEARDHVLLERLGNAVERHLNRLAELQRYVFPLVFERFEN